MKQTTNKSYFFTCGAVATQAEKKEAERVKAILVNGIYGDAFNKPMVNAYGNVPAQLKDKINEKEQAKIEKSLDAETESINEIKRESDIEMIELSLFASLEDALKVEQAKTAKLEDALKVEQAKAKTGTKVKPKLSDESTETRPA